MGKPRHVQEAIFAGDTAKLSSLGKHGGKVAGHKRRAKAAAKPTQEEVRARHLRLKYAFKADAVASWKR